MQISANRGNGRVGRILPGHGLIPAGGGGGGGSQAPIIGFIPVHDEGTYGDYFVDASVASSGAGTSIATAFKTITEAVTVWTPGKLIRVRNVGGTGIYREMPDLIGKDGLKLWGYGTEKPVITAAEPMVSWTPCVVGDAADVGPNWASMFKKTVAASIFVGGDPRTAYLFEGLQELYAATAWLDNPQYPAAIGRNSQWFTASSVALTPSGADQIINGYTLASATDPYTQGQIENADLVFLSYPNENRRSKVASFNPTTKLISPTDQTKIYENIGNANRDKFALINLLPAMKKGGWGWKDVGSGNATIYVWPNNPANMVSQISYSARGRCLKLSDVGVPGPSGLDLRGLILERCASAGTSTDQQYALCLAGSGKKSGITLKNILARNTYRANQDYAPFHLVNIDNADVENCEVDNASGQFGFFILGGLGSDTAKGLSIKRCRANSEKSGFRFYGQENYVKAFLELAGAGLSAHANLTNDYEGCHNGLWYGCNLLGGEGFGTWQEASQISIVGCFLMAGDDGRGLNDQNHSSTASPADIRGISGASYIINNTIVPNPLAPTDTRSLTAGVASNPAVTYEIYNNVLHGASDLNMAYVTSFSNNLLTNGANPAGGVNTSFSTAAAEYTDAPAGNYAYKPGAAVRSAATKNLAATIAILQARFPQFTEWGIDINGDATNWSSPPMGAQVNYDKSVAQKAVWYVPPVITGTPVVGGSLSVDNGFAKIAPYAVPTFQWNRTNDGGATYTDLMGSTSNTFTSGAGDIGYRIGVKLTVGGVTIQCTPTPPVISSFPLVITPLTPIKQLASTGSSGVNNRETATYALSGAPIVVIASQRQVTAADAVVTATVGAAGRGYGTGTPLVPAGISRRSSTESDIFYHLTPGAGNKTIQVQSNDNSFSHQVAVYEVAGMTGIGTISAVNGASTDTTRTTALNTVAANSIVMHILTRLSGNKTTNAISLTTPETLLLMDNSGGTSTTNDFTTCIAYEQAAGVGAYGATFIWPTAALVTCCAIELKS